MNSKQKRNNKRQTEVMEVTQIGPGAWMIDGKSEVYTFENGDAITHLDGSKSFVKQTPIAVRGGNNGREATIQVENDSHKIWYWGFDNLLPNQRETVIMDNDLVHELVATKMAVVEGSSRYFYRERFAEGEGKVQEEVAPPDWWKELEESTLKELRMDFDDLFEKALKNLFFHANAPIEFRRNRGGRLMSIEAWECRHWRSGKQDERGFVNDHFWCGNWGRYDRNEFPIYRTPAYNWDEERHQPKFLVPIQDMLLHDDYYAIPGWWGGRKWVGTANKIPVFHESNIDNGYFIKLHVEMPKDYFVDQALRLQGKTEKELKEFESREEQARQKFMEKVNNLFTGSDGNKVLFTEYELNKQIGKDYPGIKLHVLETNKLDESMLKLFNTAKEAVVSAQGVHPALASIQTQGKLSSGSELRNALNVYTAIKAPRYRRMLSKIYKIACNINAPEQERDIKMGFKDIVVTTLDEDVAGNKVTMGENENV